MRFKIVALTLALIGSMSGCATESHRTLSPQTVESSASAASYQGKKYVLVVGAFQNRSDYQKGLFSSGSDRLGSQAKTILKTHFQQSGRFTVVDRENMLALAEESQYSGTAQQIEGAQIVITGDVTEFGRKVTGDQQLFGILGSSKKQTAYAKVALNAVDVTSSKIVFSAQGAAEYELSNREVVGFGGTAGYDSTLNGKVLNLAITQAIDAFIKGLETGQLSLE